MTDNHENITLKEKIKKKLKESDYSPDMKAELEQLNNSTNSQQVRKMIWAVLEDNEDMFINNLENPGTLSSEEEHNVERLIGLYETFVFSCITTNDPNQLATLLYYCSPTSDFFSYTFGMICSIGYEECLSQAIHRIFLEKKGSYETFMEEEPAKTLFGDDFYRRIVQHDRVPLIKALFSDQGKLWKVPWKVDKMRELAEERKCKKVVAYLKDRHSSPTVVDPREELGRKIREDLADKIKGAVIEANVLKLEQYLQDLEVFKKDYKNLDDLLNEIVTREKGGWKGERLMHWACRKGDLALCKALYNKGASLRVVDSNFHTPAHVAIEEDHLHVLEWLHECDDNLIRVFFDFGWRDPCTRDKYLFTLKEGNGKKNVNLPVLGFLLQLKCDSLLTEKNIDYIINAAIDTSDGDYSCIDTLLGKGEAICNQIKPIHLEKAAKQNSQILSKLLAAASRECIDEVIDSVIGKDRTLDVSRNGKRIFREMSKLKDGRLLRHPRVSSYIDHQLISILPYYIDLFVIIFHLLCITCYCVTYGANMAKNGHNKGHQHGEGKYTIRWIFFGVTAALSVKQFIEAYFEGRKFINWQDMVECLSYFLSFAVIFSKSFLEQWELVLIILCLFISWFDLFMKLKVTPLKLGLYIEMFYSILKIFMSVISMFIMFLLCFSTAFYTLFHQEKSFRSRESVSHFLVGIFGKILAMMTGEFDFNGLFFPSDSLETATTTITPDINGTSSKVEYPDLMAHCVFFLFCICLHILLLNLLVGLAVDDISKLTKDSEDRRRRKQAELIADLAVFWDKVEFLYGLIVCRKCRHPQKEAKIGTGTTVVVVEPQILTVAERQALIEQGPQILTVAERQALIEQGPQILRENSPHTVLNSVRTFSQLPYINWFFAKLGLHKLKKSPDEATPETQEMAEKLEKMERKRQEREETNKTLDLMKEVILQLDKRNRDLVDVIKEMDNRTREILQRVPSPAVAQ